MDCCSQLHFNPLESGGDKCLLFKPLMGLYHGIKYDTSLWQPKHNPIPGKATQAVWPRVDKTPETEPGFAGKTQRYLLGCEMTLVPLPALLSPGLADVTYKVGRKFAQT